MDFNEWAKRVYDEEDFGRSVSITLSGSVGLLIYLGSRDWVLALFVTVIVFPVFRVVASALHGRWREKRKQNMQVFEAQKRFETLSPQERDVVRAFVEAGGAALTWSQINRAALAVSAIESLVLRGILSTSVTSDGMTETFVMQTEIFDAALQAYPRAHALPDRKSEDIPF